MANYFKMKFSSFMMIRLFVCITLTVVSKSIFSQGTTPSVYSVQWTNLTGVSVNGTTVTKTASSSWGNGGAASSNILPASTDGWVEFQFPTTLPVLQIAFGLSSTDLNADYKSINFAIFTNSTNVYVYENGTLKLM